MRCLIVGAGSIGSRRARLLAEMGHEVMLYDAAPERAVALYQELRHPNVRASLWGNPWTGTGYGHDAALICTPAHTHLAVARQAIESGCKALFIEKPLSTSMDGVVELVEECERRGVGTMGACNMRFALTNVYDVMGYCPRLSIEDSRPLDDWRSGARAAYGDSGIMLEAGTHWLDLARAMSGLIESVFVVHGDDDHVRLEVAHYGHRYSEILLDWRPSAPTVREVIRWDALGRHMVGLDTSDKMYVREMTHFLGSAEGSIPTCNPIANAAETLRWALHARDLTRKVAV